MFFKMWLQVIFFVVFVLGCCHGDNKKPNIIVIVADDMGFNDVGFHGSDEIPTPNIDALAYNGVILNQHYTQALCTPSRSAFLTGKYPINLGMQHLVILEPEPWGLSLNETLLPQHLKRNGYATHAVGKWHLGFFKKEYTPTYRGFDTHFGYWQGLQDYYDHTVHATFTPEHGYDMRRNMSVAWDAKGKYSTTLFTEEAVRLIQEHDKSNPMFMYLAHLAPHTGNDKDPLQAPDEEIAKFSHIDDPERRIYAAMVSMLDKSVGSVITALRENHMLENSIILFMSDNGAQTEGIHANHGSNYPLRGMKNSAFEGASRGVAAIWSPLIKKSQRVSNHLMHISDWLPTFFGAAGLEKSQLPKIDGIDQWPAISQGEEGTRHELVYNIDPIWKYGGIRQTDWKYIYGSTTKGKRDMWYGSSGRNSTYKYNSDLVLSSKAGSALAAVLTYEQIKNKNKNFTADVKLLGKNVIARIRQTALVSCDKVDYDTLSNQSKCTPDQTPCLINLKNDPCEYYNVAHEYPEIVKVLTARIEILKKSAIPPRNVPRDVNADPKFFNGTWSCWQDQDIITEKLPINVLSPLTIGLIVGAVVAFILIASLLILMHLKKPKTSRHSSIFEVSMEDRGARKSDNAFEDREMQVRTNFLEKSRC